MLINMPWRCKSMEAFKREKEGLGCNATLNRKPVQLKEQGPDSEIWSRFDRISIIRAHTS